MRIKYRSCPMCSSPAFTKAGEYSCVDHHVYSPELPSTISWMKCDECGHVFTDGYFTKEALEIIFRKTQSFQTPGSATAEGRSVWGPVVSMISAMRGWNYSGSWLDVGFGSGALVAAAVEFGYQAAGIDLREQSVSAMATMGYEVYAASLGQIGQAESFDVMSMADVLEHTPFPGDELKHANRLLKPGGHLFVSTPNMECVVWKLWDMANNNPYWREMEHCHNFSRESLYALLRRNGFEPVRFEISNRYAACMDVVSVKK
ncbi:MAG: class I SAM-dependent methyltransferase [Nitrospinae bacterium]|nr:class I SAM-dependent methyltransferase [Nitrospinota bacterium]